MYYSLVFLSLVEASIIEIDVIVHTHFTFVEREEQTADCTYLAILFLHQLGGKDIYIWLWNVEIAVIRR